MKTFTKIKQWFVGGCVWYAIVSLIFLIIDLALSKDALHVISSTSFSNDFPYITTLTLRVDAELLMLTTFPLP